MQQGERPLRLVVRKPTGPRLTLLPSMKIYADRMSAQERQDLAELASGLRRIAAHELTRQLAATLDEWATAPAGREFDTATLDQSGQQMEAAQRSMSGRDQQAYRAEFFAASECRFAARGAGMKAPQSFRDNVADAARALSAAQH